MLILPKRLDGELSTVAMCLRDEDMERLRMDEEFAKYKKYIGRDGYPGWQRRVPCCIYAARLLPTILG